MAITRTPNGYVCDTLADALVATMRAGRVFLKYDLFKSCKSVEIVGRRLSVNKDGSRQLMLELENGKKLRVRIEEVA